MILAALAPEAVQNLVVWGSNSFVAKEDKEAAERVKDLNSWSDKMKAPLEGLKVRFCLCFYENCLKVLHDYI